MKNSKAVYTNGSIGGTMLKTALAMLPGTIALSGYNIADTYFVAKLGTLPLAAMGFTFPVIMLIGCVFMGLAMGAMTPLAHALGRKNHKKGAKLCSAGLLLICIVSILSGIIGYFTIDPVFRQFGAGPDVMILIHEFMEIWYLGSITAALSMAANDVLVASGSPKSASAMTVAGMLLNIILDPIFIFGWGFIPAMGIKGAALATVISQMLSALLIMSLLHYKFRLLTLAIFDWRLLRNSWGVIIRIAVPSIIGILLMPIGNAIMTRIIAEFGAEAVAACAAAGRMEIIAFVVPMALGKTLVPMVAQNYGARLYERINECRRFSMRFAGIFCFIMTLLFVAFSKWLPAFFSNDPNVCSIMTQYLIVISWGFGMMEIHRYSGFFYTGCNKPSGAAWLNIYRIAGLLIPFSLTAMYFHSMTGLFVARLASDLIAGATGMLLVRRMTKKFLEGKDKTDEKVKFDPELVSTQSTEIP